MEQIITLKVDLFSPPYGDGIAYLDYYYFFVPFSPPYGDGIAKIKTGEIVIWFSPPYGDGILNISQNTVKLKSRMARKYSLYYNDVLLC